jgi:hypothetical protein
MEIVAAGRADSGFPSESLEADFPNVRFVLGPACGNVPQLWAAGIQCARGDIVALTIENCVPAPDWARQLLTAHKARWSGIGGAIEIVSAAKLVDWAVYFSRYSSYMPPFDPRFLDDLPGDNCSYKREALARACAEMKDGFWETFVHWNMRKRNERLQSVPLPVVTYQGGISGWKFLRRRYKHGRYFAARRSADFSTKQRLLRVAGFLAIPPLLLFRIAGRVWRNGRHRAKFVETLPLIFCFLGAWALGEAAGYAAGSSAVPLEQD